MLGYQHVYCTVKQQQPTCSDAYNGSNTSVQRAAACRATNEIVSAVNVLNTTDGK